MFPTRCPVAASPIPRGQGPCRASSKRCETGDPPGGLWPIEPCCRTRVEVSVVVRSWLVGVVDEPWKTCGYWTSDQVRQIARTGGEPPFERSAACPGARSLQDRVKDLD